MDPTILIWTIIISSSIFLIFHLTKPNNPHRNLPPGSQGWPVIGESLEFLRRSREGAAERFVEDRITKYNSEIFRTSLMGEAVVAMTGAAGNKFIFSNGNKTVTTWWPASVRKLLGPCLTTCVGDEAKMMRKLMSYFVSPDALQRLYITSMDLVTQQHIHTHWQGKEVLKVFPVIKLHNFNLACRFFMNVEDQNRIEKLSHLFNIFLKGIISLAVEIPGTRFHRAMRATALIREELLGIIEQRRETVKQNNKAFPRQDLLSHLLVTPDEHGEFMPDSHIANNILLLLFAGHDTSTVTITLLIKVLAELPHVYEKVLQEHREIAASKEAGEFLQWDDVQRMKYSWNVVCEVMRKYTPVQGAFREALVDIKYDGYDIPKGWKLYWNAQYTHLNPNHFPDPTKFDPSRFEGEGPAPYTFVPFGGGPRMCWGKEFARLQILVFLHNLVTRFRWSLVVPDEKLDYDPMPTPVQGLPIRLYPHTL